MCIMQIIDLNKLAFKRVTKPLLPLTFHMSLLVSSNILASIWKHGGKGGSKIYKIICSKILERFRD